MSSPAVADRPALGARPNPRRLLWLLSLALGAAVVVSLVARGLVWLINLFTNLAFFGKLSLAYHSPADNALGLWVVALPALGGGLVSLLALYGSKAIRGHGIPEAMEQILTNESRIRPAIMVLKPLSAAISIGTGGPFGAEGPIIATGGALGSTLGQLLRITAHERKVLLAAGATAGMAAIFGTPLAAVFLAVELLLFEFSPRSLLPVAGACLVGAAGHRLLFEAGPVFPMPAVAAPGAAALALYCGMGAVVGLAAVGVTKLVYAIEDWFERLPLHWAWWPVLGGLAVGGVGYFAPRTLGVGYENISTVLAGNAPLQLLLTLCLLKFISWAVSLGSGTSGGTLAPLLTIGGATGALLGLAVQALFPAAGLSVPLAALVGMAAMFAGAARALLTAIVFAAEATGLGTAALLPLLGGSAAAYLVSWLLMPHTIMTEKIARRGISTPVDYEPNDFEQLRVAQALSQPALVLPATTSVAQARARAAALPASELLAVLDEATGQYRGVLKAGDLVAHTDSAAVLGELLSGPAPTPLHPADPLRRAVEALASSAAEALPVRAPAGDATPLAGLLTYADVLRAYRRHLERADRAAPHLYLRRRGLRALLRGRQWLRRPAGPVRR